MWDPYVHTTLPGTWYLYRSVCVYTQDTGFKGFKISILIKILVWILADGSEYEPQVICTLYDGRRQDKPMEVTLRKTLVD